jgi:hypothetical protein
MMKGKWFRTTGVLLISGLFLVTSLSMASSSSGGKDNSQRRIEKEKARKDKESKKQYDKAIKQHMKNQSAATRSMMKQTKKDSPKNTPLKPSSRKKCK